jgi:uncharacterized protein (DUF433 family)
MTYHGTVKNGVVVFHGAPPLADGTPVSVEPLGEAASRIYKNPRVAGGDACVGDTRIPVWSLVRFRQLGRTDEQLLGDFPSLTAADLAAAWSYAAEHGDEIDRALLEQERA